MSGDPLSRFLLRAQYGLRSGARLAWYAGHRNVTRRISSQIFADMPAADKPAVTARPTPDRQQTLKAIVTLLGTDLANIEQGLYPLPNDEPGGLPGAIARSRRYLRDVPEAARRRREGNHRQADELAGSSQLPDYYRRNFHFQTDGWLSAESARLYDTQVEVLFSGTAAAMRRQGLEPLVERARRIDQRRMVHGDIACGSGAFLRDVKQSLPRMKCIGIDLSVPYLTEARRRLKPFGWVRMVNANAETLPLASSSLDSASLVYLLHELPAKVRPRVLREMGRVIKPGGIAVIVDSLQYGDAPEFDGLLEVFPQLFHEPYFASYASNDLIPTLTKAGFQVIDIRTAFLSKVMVLERM